MNDSGGEETGISVRLGALAHALGELLDEASGDPDADASFRAAEAILLAASGVRGRAAMVKARAALRIRDDEQLSLTELADRLGISKQRADQLVRQALGTTRPRRRTPPAGDAAG